MLDAHAPQVVAVPPFAKTTGGRDQYKIASAPRILPLSYGVGSWLATGRRRLGHTQQCLREAGGPGGTGKSDSILGR